MHPIAAEPGPVAPPSPRLLNRVRDQPRTKHYRIRRI